MKLVENLDCNSFRLSKIFAPESTVRMDSLWKRNILLVGFALITIPQKVNLELAREYDSCSYSFKVWQPGSDMILKMNTLEAKYANVSNYVDKELLKIRFGASSDLHRYHNWTMNLERSIMELKIKQIERITEMKDLKKEIDRFNGKLQEVGTKVDEFILHFGERKPKAFHRKQHVRKDRMITSSSGTQLDQPDKYIMDVLKNMVSDLKSEWILMKRDLLDMRTEIFDLKQGQNQLYNTSIDVRGLADQLQERYLNLQNSDFKHANDIGNLVSNLDSLKQDFQSLKTTQEQQNAEIETANSDISFLRNKATKLQRGIDRIQSGNAYDGGHSSRTSGSSLQRPLGDVVRVVTSSKIIPTDCYDVYSMGYRTSGVYQVQPSANLPMDNMYCEMVNNTGLTVIQRRTDGLLTFNRGWLEYKVGFGNLYGDFWAGNEVIHHMTKKNQYGLRIDMWDWEGNRSYAEYVEFSTENESNSYRLHVSGYSGNAGDSLSYHDKMKFSTEDLDNDIHVRNCASDNKSGWWYNGCYFSQLNGVYHTGWYSHAQSTYADGIVWYTLKDSERYSLRHVEMKLWRHV